MTRGKDYAEGKVKSWIFTYEDGKKVLLMNTSASAVNDIDVSEVLETESYSVEQYYAPDVIKSPVTEGDGIEKKKYVANGKIEVNSMGYVVISRNE